MKIRWSTTPQPHDYPGAVSYLTLLTDRPTAERLVESLSRQPVVGHKAKDILRAARLPLLPADDPYVASDLKRVRKGKKLSPILMIRGELDGAPLIIADGYHRVCAAYHLSQDTDVSAQITTNTLNAH